MLGQNVPVSRSQSLLIEPHLGLHPPGLADQLLLHEADPHGDEGQPDEAVAGRHGQLEDEVVLVVIAWKEVSQPDGGQSDPRKVDGVNQLPLGVNGFEQGRTKYNITRHQQQGHHNGNADLVKHKCMVYYWEGPQIKHIFTRGHSF